MRGFIDKNSSKPEPLCGMSVLRVIEAALSTC
jgi:hypothetical protein